MSRNDPNDQKLTLKQKNRVLLLYLIVTLIFLLAACDTDTSGGGQSNTAGNSSSTTTTNTTGSPQRPDPCSLISAGDLQQLIPGSQFPAPTSEGDLNQGGTESGCRFIDTHGITVVLTIKPAGTIWSGMKAFQSQDTTAIPEVKGVGDDALYYYGVLEIFQENYVFQVQVAYNSTTSMNTIQEEEKQIALKALKNW